jgi:alpha-aminoadipic semialdehyde synthase
LQRLIKDTDIVISFVPAPFHTLIAKVCLENSKNLVTSSYISPQMKELDGQVKEKGLIFLNECGLDPGIDHIITMKLLDDIKDIKAE